MLLVLFAINELPLIAANPPIIAPTNEVTIININEEPRENNWAILLDKILLLLISIHVDKTSHKRNIPINPDKKLRQIGW